MCHEDIKQHNINNTFFSEVTYFQIKELLEQVKDTESGKKNFFGQYSSQNMKVK